MAIANKLVEDFHTGMIEVNELLLKHGFVQSSLEIKGLASFVKYQRSHVTLTISFGPADWEVQMTVFIRRQKFEFKDLLQIPSIAQWVERNRYQQLKRDVPAELHWYFNLLIFSLSTMASE